jgi:hypothetical protein
MLEKEQVSETLAFNFELSWLVAQKDLINSDDWESFKSNNTDAPVHTQQLGS